jgi:hypothetical protein
MAIRAMADSRRAPRAVCQDCKKTGDSYCEYHRDLVFPIENLKSLSRTWESALCPREEGAVYHKKACIYGKCEICKDRSKVDCEGLFKWTSCEKEEEGDPGDNAKLYEIEVKVHFFGKTPPPASPCTRTMAMCASTSASTIRK